MYFKDFVVLSINHNNLSVEAREKINTDELIKKITELHNKKNILGFVTLLTCLRVEFYLLLAPNYSLDDLLGQIAFKEIEVKRGEEAVNYLFRITCGFESVIKGEDQVLAQVKNAYDTSLKNLQTSTSLNVIFHKAIEVGKKFRTESKICHNALSIEAISVKFIKSKVGSLKDKKILMLGCGDLSKSILKILAKEEVSQIKVANRTFDTAQKFSQEYNVAFATKFEDRYDDIVTSDVIISATLSPNYVVEHDKLFLTQEERNYLFLDLAFPRDIESSVGNIKRVSLYNLDDAWAVYDSNLENREQLLEEYGYLLDEQMSVLKKWFDYKETNI